ncbi:MAG: Plug domain-containing protein [Bacteroides sp.]|nr:Plug domain-containing protein [Bacteroides sp.]
MKYYTVAYICLTLLSGLSVVSGQTQMSHLDSLRNVHLQEVVVIAVQPDVPGTYSVIGQEAIRHIQATDLSGLSQLLPGVLTRNPDLNVPAAFTIRSASYYDATNAMGTAIVVDGLRMNNNTNMQQATLGGVGKLFNSSILSGYDVRALASSSIEGVEVIRGVPSARYGDVTSGVVLVKSKAGIQPYTAGLRFTATEKLATVGKGLSLGRNNGTLYVGADYALSTQDARQPEQTF